MLQKQSLSPMVKQGQRRYFQNLFITSIEEIASTDKSPYFGPYSYSAARANLCRRDTRKQVSCCNNRSNKAQEKRDITWWDHLALLWRNESEITTIFTWQNMAPHNKAFISNHVCLFVCLFSILGMNLFSGCPQ